jgi:membrane protein required for colicin V production
MTLLDWGMLAVILLSMLLAAAQGFLYEVFSFAGVIVGYLAAAWGYTRVAVWYAPHVKAAWVADIAGFLTIFVGVVLLAGIVGRLARWSAKEAGLRWFDRLLGGAFGFARGIIVVAVVLLAMATFTPDSRLLARSQVAPYALVVARAAVWVAPAQLRAQFRHGMLAMRDLRSEVPVKAGTTGAAPGPRTTAGK